MKNRRRQIIVDKNFQYKQVLSKALIAIVAANIMILLAFRFFPYELSAVLGPFTWTIAIFEVAIIVGVLYFGAKASQKIAGPAYALKRVFERVGNGDLSARAHLRKGDHLLDVAEAFNSGADRLTERIKTLHTSAEELLGALPEGSPGREQASQLHSQATALLSPPAPDAE
jgi:methyl-accepting chemotaxis protein